MQLFPSKLKILPGINLRERNLPFIPLDLLVAADLVRAVLSKLTLPAGVWEGSDLAGDAFILGLGITGHSNSTLHFQLNWTKSGYLYL